MTRADDDRQGMTAALGGSVALHLALLLLFATVAGSLRKPPVAPLPPPPEPVRVVLRPRPVPTPSPERIAATNPADAPELDKEPENPLIESDRNVAASSRSNPLPGPADLPSQEGRALPAVRFDESRFTPDRAGASAQPPAPALPQATPQPPHPTPVPTVPPVARPTPTAPPRTDAVAVLRPTPRPTPPPTPPPELTRQSPQSQRPPTPSSQYRPHSEPTRIVGGISNRGRGAVAAMATPLGRYRKQIEDAIGSRWHHYVQARMDLLSVGTVRLKFRVRPDGRPEAIRVSGNDSNEAFATACVQSVTDAEIPPIPPEVAQTLEDNRLEVEYSFTIY